MTLREEVHSAIAAREPAVLRRMAKRAVDQQTEACLLLLAEIVEEQNRTMEKRIAWSQSNS